MRTLISAVVEHQRSTSKSSTCEAYKISSVLSRFPEMKTVSRMMAETLGNIQGPQGPVPWMVHTVQRSTFTQGGTSRRYLECYLPVPM